MWLKQKSVCPEFKRRLVSFFPVATHSQITPACEPSVTSYKYDGPGIFSIASDQFIPLSDLWSLGLALTTLVVSALEAMGLTYTC